MHDTVYAITDEHESKRDKPTRWLETRPLPLTAGHPRQKQIESTNAARNGLSLSVRHAVGHPRLTYFGGPTRERGL